MTKGWSDGPGEKGRLVMRGLYLTGWSAGHVGGRVVSDKSDVSDVSDKSDDGTAPKPATLQAVPWPSDTDLPCGTALSNHTRKPAKTLTTSRQPVYSRTL